MATVVKNFDDLTKITSGSVESGETYIYLSRPNESLAADKDTTIKLDELYYLLDSDNAYYNSGWFYKATGEASLYESTSGVHVFYSAVSGSADAAITFIETMRTGLSSNNSKVVSIGKDTFEAWNTGAVLQLGGKGFNYEDSTNIIWGYNAYYDGAWKYTETDEASRLYQENGELVFESAASGSADDPITWVDSFSSSPTNFNIYAGGMNFLSNETISSNTTITLEKYQKIRTVILTGAITQLTVNKGTGTDESNVLRIINNTSTSVTITDGSSPIVFYSGEQGDFYFLGSSLTPKVIEYYQMITNETFVLKKGTNFLHLVIGGATTIATLNFTNCIDGVTVFARNQTSGDVTIQDAITTNSFKVSPTSSAIFTTNASQKLLKVSANVNYNSGIIDPREEFRGNIHTSSNIIENTLFDAWSSYIPNTNDIMKINGGATGNAMSIVERTGANTMSLKYSYSGGIVSIPITDGGAGIVFTSGSISW